MMSALCFWRHRDLHEPSRAGIRPRCSPSAGVAILIAVEQRRPQCGGKTSERSESVIHRAGFVTAVHHAVRAFRISALRAVTLPFGFADEFIKGIRVAVLQ